MEQNTIILYDFSRDEKSTLKDFFAPFNFELIFDNFSDEAIKSNETKSPKLIIINYLMKNSDKENYILKLLGNHPEIQFLIFCHNIDYCSNQHNFNNLYIYKLQTEPNDENFYQLVLEAFHGNFICKIFNISILIDTVFSQRKKYYKVFQLAKKLSSDINLDSLLEKIVDFTCEVLDSERSTVFLIDKNKGEFWSKVGIGLDKKEIRFPIDKGIAGEVVRTGVTLFINDPYSHPSFNRTIDDETGFLTRNILCVPLWNLTGEIIGVFQVLNKKDGSFTKDDEDMLYTFSTNAAKSIENAQLYEERSVQLEQLKKSYTELQDAQDRILRQEKLATIGQVFAGITHEVKNQLTIVSAVSSIKRLYPEDKKIERYTNLIIEARNRIINLLNEIRDFSKKSSYEKKLINLIELVSSTIEFCKFDKVLEFIKLELIKPEQEKILVFANEDKIKQVVINILRNAGQASKQYSKIFISIEIIENSVILQIQDFGSGIPYEIQDIIWDPFYTTKSDGTGLGLDICKKIIESHDGKIYFKSEPGQGTSFFIQLPLINE